MSTYDDLEKRVIKLEKEVLNLNSRIVRLVSAVEESLDPSPMKKPLRVRADPRAEPIAVEAKKELRSARDSAQGLARVLGMKTNDKDE